MNDDEIVEALSEMLRELDLVKYPKAQKLLEHMISNLEKKKLSKEEENLEQGRVKNAIK